MSTLIVAATGAIASASSTSTAAAPALPTGTASGDLLVMFVTWKQKTATFTTPSGWTRLGSDAISANGAAYAASAGDVRVAAMYKTAGSSETAPTLSALSGGSTTNTTGNIMQAWIHRIASVGAGWTWSLTDTEGSQNTSATSWTLTGAVSLTSQGSDVSPTGKADVLFAGTALMDDGPSVSSAIFDSVLNGGTTHNAARVGSTVGADMGSWWMTFDDASTAITGTDGGSIAPSNNSTYSATCYGATKFVRARAVPPNQALTGLTGITSAEAFGSGASIALKVSGPTPVGASTATTSITNTFESGGVDGWQCTVTQANSSSFAHSGSKSLTTIVNQTSSYTWTSPAYPAATNELGHVFDFYGYNDVAGANTSVAVTASYRNSSDVQISSALLGSVTCDNSGWAHFSGTLGTLPAGTVAIRFFLAPSISSGSARIYLDDATLTTTTDAVGRPSITSFVAPFAISKPYSTGGAPTSYAWPTSGNVLGWTSLAGGTTGITTIADPLTQHSNYSLDIGAASGGAYSPWTAIDGVGGELAVDMYASFYKSSGSPTFTFSVEWGDVSQAVIGTTTFYNVTDPTMSVWSELLATLEPPSNSVAYCRVKVALSGGVGAEAIIDDVTLTVYGASIGVPVVVPVITPSGIASLEAIGTHALGLNVAGVGNIASTEAFGSATIASVVSPVGIATPTVTTTYDFESGGLPTGWSLEGKASSATQSTTVAVSGTHSLLVSMPNTFIDGGVYTDYIPVNPGAAVRASAWYRLTAAGSLGTPRMRFEYCDASHSFVGQGDYNGGLQSGWYQYAQTDTAPAGSVYYRVLFYYNTTSTSFYLDDASLYSDPLGVPTLGQGGAQTLDLTGDAIASAEAFGSHKLNLNIAAAGAIASAEAFGSHTVTPGAVTISPTGLSTAETFGSLVVSLNMLVGAGPPSAEAFSSPVLTLLTAISATDACTSADSVTLAVAATATDSATVQYAYQVSAAPSDSATAAETVSISATSTATDTGVATEGASLALSSADQALAGETGAPAAAASTSDTASATENSSVAAAPSSTDTATITEAVALAVTSSDSASCAEANSIAAALTTTDPGILNDGGGLLQQSGTDSASSTDAATSIAATAASDTASVAEVASLSVASSDTSAVTETGSTSATPSSTDTATLTQAGSLALSSSDTSSVTETASLAAIASTSDSANVTESASLAVTASEVATSAEAGSIASTTTTTDAYAATEAASLATSMSDAGALTEAGANAATVATAESASATETAGLALSTTDSCSGSESGALTNAATASESGSLAESAVISLSAADAASLSEAAAIVPAIVSSDSAAITETGALGVTALDVAVAGETGSIAAAATTTESGAIGDAGTVAAAVTGADSSTSADTVALALATTDASTVVEVTFVAATVTGADPGILNDGPGLLQQSATDSASSTDAAATVAAVAGVESAVLAEAASLAVTSSEAALLSDVGSVDATASSTDSAAVVETAVPGPTTTDAALSTDTTNVSATPSSTDTAAITEAAALAISATDSAAATEAGTVSSATTATDATAIASEAASVAAAVAGSETGTTSDSPAIATSASESATANHASSLLATVAASEAGANTDAATLGISSTDTATVVEALGPQGRSGTDAASSSETASLVVAAADSDVGACSESGGVAGQTQNIVGSDAAAVSETIAVAITIFGSDSFTATDTASAFASLSSPDDAATSSTTTISATVAFSDGELGIESAVISAVSSDTDAASATVAATLSAVIATNDPLFFNDGPAAYPVAFSSSDAAAATETASAAATVAATDPFTADEAGIATRLGDFVLVDASDAGSLGDAGTVLATLGAADTSGAQESASSALQSADTATLLDGQGFSNRQFFGAQPLKITWVVATAGVGIVAGKGLKN